MVGMLGLVVLLLVEFRGGEGAPTSASAVADSVPWDDHSDVDGCGALEWDESGLLQRKGGHAAGVLLQDGGKANASDEKATAVGHTKSGSGCGRFGKTSSLLREGTERLDAGDIEKYVTPLVIPPVMRREKANRKLNKYSISARKFKQQILPGGIWNSSVWGIVESLSQDYDATTVFGYGPTDDPEPNCKSLQGCKGPGIAPAPNSQFNYPGYTVENTRNHKTWVDWHNDLVKDPWSCDFSHPAGEACEYIRHMIPIDQSLHWANPAEIPCANGRSTDCRPANVGDPRLASEYTGPVPMVVHVHGAHVHSNSDGYPEAWWLPAASNVDGFARAGALVNRFDRRTNQRDGVASFQYMNDQPSTTLWFHDHTLGMTRNNVYAGMVAFWLIREKGGGETGLVKGTLPCCAPKLGDTLEDTNLPSQYGGRRNTFREIPIAVMDRSFYKNGSLFYPSDRAFFQGLTPEELAVPLIGNVTFKSDVPPIWNPEAFFDVMTANGVSWPVLKVEPDLYRFRLLNGCDARFLNLALCIVNASGDDCPLNSMTGAPLGEELDFFVIGREQGLLPKVVRVSTGFKTVLPGDGSQPTNTQANNAREALLLSPAERADVILDFRHLQGKVVRLINTAPDGPFAGFDTIDFQPADQNTTGQVMEFHVIDDDLTVGEKATPPEFLKLELPDAEDPANQVQLDGNENPKNVKTRDLALLEAVSKLICATENGSVWDESVTPVNGSCPSATGNIVPFGPTAVLLGIKGNTNSPVPVMWEDPIVTNPAKSATEIWEFWNWSVDSHPIHLHLVKFRVLQRFKFSVDDEGKVMRGYIVPEDPTEAGWKDTAVAYPNQVLRIAATFDIAGLYVWHCHILEHEDNEMMNPFCVGDKERAPGCDAVP